MKKYTAVFENIIFSLLFSTLGILLFLICLHHPQYKPYLFIPMIFAAIGAAMLIIAVREASMHLHLERTGTKISAAVMSVAADMHHMVNGYPTFILTCSAEIDGRMRTFTRKNLRETQIHDLNESVTVCYNKDKPDEYYIDL